MKRFALILFLLYSAAASTQTLRGVVTNGTSNKPSAGDEVLLKRPGNGGMEDAGKTTTNARGEFTFNVPQAPYVIWVKHQDVTYTAVAPPGSKKVAVQVFDKAMDVGDVRVVERVIFLQTAQGNDSSLGVEELYTLVNSSKPPRTQSGGNTLEIYLPEGATLQDAAARFADGMALKTAPVPQTEKNKYAFVYPIRPGETQFEIVYALPYSGKRGFDPRFGAGGSLAVVTPTSMKFTAADNSVYQPTNSPQFPGMNLYVARDISAQQRLGFTIEGAGVISRGNEQATAAGGGNAPQAEDNRPGGGLGVPNSRPNPLHSVQWTFLGVLFLFLAVGAVYVYFSNQREPAPAPAKNKPQDRRATLMDALKEEIFQLETDRLQGKISSQEYDSAKAALDKTLQRAVQRQKSR